MFGQIACGTVNFVWVDYTWAVGFVWVDCVQMVILFVWDAWKNMMEIGRGGAYVPARVALQGRIHRSSPAHDAYVFGYGNAATRTCGRAHRHRPYGFVWMDYAWDS